MPPFRRVAGYPVGGATPVAPTREKTKRPRRSRVRRGRMIVCQFQGVVKDRIVVEGTLKGIPIPVEALQKLKAGQRP